MYIGNSTYAYVFGHPPVIRSCCEDTDRKRREYPIPKIVCSACISATASGAGRVPQSLRNISWIPLCCAGYTASLEEDYTIGWHGTFMSRWNGLLISAAPNHYRKLSHATCVTIPTCMVSAALIYCEMWSSKVCATLWRTRSKALFLNVRVFAFSCNVRFELFCSCQTQIQIRTK